MKHLKTALWIAVVTLVCCTRSHATGFSSPPDISTTKVGIATDHNTFLWEWDVYHGSQPSLSHWVLIDLCDDVYSDIVDGSLYGGTSYAFGFDPPTGETGLKFEVDGQDLEHSFFGFETTKCWEPGLMDVAFKSGQLVTFQDNVVGPSCEPCDDIPTGHAPEPASMALLGLGVAGIGARMRRKLRG